MKVLVCGGRNFHLFDGYKIVNATLSKLHAEKRITCIVTGGATGADSLAEEWAVENRIHVARYPANWKLHGKSAGPRRNEIMLKTEQPELVVAFPGGAGTQDMLRRAKRAGVTCKVVD